MRLIDADELLTHEVTIHVEEVGYSHRSIDPYWVETAPTIEAEPIKHGRWILNRQGNWACSLCGNDPYHSNMHNMNYCPNCGAKMDEVEE